MSARKRLKKASAPNAPRVRAAKRGAVPRVPVREGGEDVRRSGGLANRKDTRLRAVRVGEGLPPIPRMMEELQDMTDVLLGRVEPPIQKGTMTLMEVADIYFGRASEMTMLLHALEREGQITRGSAHYKFRTGELRDFMEMAKRAADLGSRRLTEEQLQFEMATYGRETKGGVPR